MENRAQPSKVRDLMILGAVVGVIILGLGLYSAATTGWDSGFVLPLIFSLAGVVATWFGTLRRDVTIWGGGLIATALLIPTRFGLIPLGVALILIAFTAVLIWKNRKA